MIRDATHTDTQALVEMGQQFLSSSEYRDVLTNNPEQMAALVDGLIDRDGGVVLVSERNGALTGMIGLLIVPHHLSAEPTAMEAFWWSGGSGDGVRLMRAAEAWAHKHGAVMMQMVAPSDRVGAFYERMGYSMIERGYIRRLGA